MRFDKDFDELAFFAEVKKRPGLFLGEPSLLSLRDLLTGMDIAFRFDHTESPLKHFHSFVNWYHEEKLADHDTYACWWNHILYISSNRDRLAYVRFFELFERYLKDVQHLSLPDADNGSRNHEDA